MTTAIGGRGIGRGLMAEFERRRAARGRKLIAVTTQRAAGSCRAAGCEGPATC